jgi:phosphoribosylformimino-5-aminoimidazole carboxamide ribotide isomerase
MDEGAQWIHVVNLDGAFGDDKGANSNALRNILKETTIRGVRVQFGGGLRSLADIQAALALGVSRVILGTIAVSNPDMLAEAVKHYGSDAIGIGIDTRDGLVRTHGWQKPVKINPVSLALQAKQSGIRIAVYTNIARDGAGTGVDIKGTTRLSKATGMTVIASGGIASMADIQRVKHAGLPGVIVGRALYEGAIDLKEALLC